MENWFETIEKNKTLTTPHTFVKIATEGPKVGRCTDPVQ
jgi:hypothetical protein